MDFLHSKRESPGRPGLMLGKVVANYDDKFKGMVQVAFYSYEEKAKTTDWMRVSSALTGKGKGLYFLPDVGDEVIVAFINDDPEHPCVIGSLWNDNDEYPKDAVNDKNDNKLFVTKTGVKIAISDEEGKACVSVTTPKDIKIRLSDDGEKIEMESGGENRVVIDGGTGEITIQSKGKLNIRTNELHIKADTKVHVESTEILLNGNSSLKLQSSGIAELKGSMVKING